MLLYGEILELAGLSHYLAYFGPCKKQLLAVKIEPLNGIEWNFKFSKGKKFLTIAKKDNSVEKHLGGKKMQKHGGRFTWHGLYNDPFEYLYRIRIECLCYSYSFSKQRRKYIVQYIVQVKITSKSYTEDLFLLFLIESVEVSYIGSLCHYGCES